MAVGLRGLFRDVLGNDWSPVARSWAAEELAARPEAHFSSVREASR